MLLASNHVKDYQKTSEKLKSSSYKTRGSRRAISPGILSITYVFSHTQTLQKGRMGEVYYMLGSMPVPPAEHSRTVSLVSHIESTSFTLQGGAGHVVWL